jgi:hypothetical protein
MQVTFMNVRGLGSVLVHLPETNAELRTLLDEHGHEAYCEDCEQTLDDLDAGTCPTCGEGRLAETEYTKTREKTQ